MNAVKAAGIVLVVVGVLVLLFSGFTYTHDTHAARIGSVELSVSHRRTVDVPVWAGVAAIVLGGVLILARK